MVRIFLKPEWKSGNGLDKNHSSGSKQNEVYPLDRLMESFYHQQKNQHEQKPNMILLCSLLPHVKEIHCVITSSV